MIVLNYKGKSEKLIKYLSKEVPNLSYSNVMKLLRKKDIKINGKRVHDNVDLFDGDKLEIYDSPDMLKKNIQLDVVFEDENIIVVNKPAGIEIENESEEDLLTIVKGHVGNKVYACHRLDRNTTGLVIFAKTKVAEKELFDAFKKRTIEKHYKALVFGKAEKEAELKAYLFKDDKKAQVYISDIKKDGYDKIETRYTLIEEDENVSLLDVELVTGKTHQIRAHLAHVGLPIVGDSKYGDNKKNKIYKKKRQELTAYKLMFNFKENSPLVYLNNKIIQI